MESSVKAPPKKLPPVFHSPKPTVLLQEADDLCGPAGSAWKGNGAPKRRALSHKPAAPGAWRSVPWDLKAVTHDTCITVTHLDD